MGIYCGVCELFEKNKHKGYWAIYTNNQAYAKALAGAFGGTKRPVLNSDTPSE